MFVRKYHYYEPPSLYSDRSARYPKERKIWWMIFDSDPRIKVSCHHALGTCIATLPLLPRCLSAWIHATTSLAFPYWFEASNSTFAIIQAFKLYSKKLFIVLKKFAWSILMQYVAVLSRGRTHVKSFVSTVTSLTVPSLVTAYQLCLRLSSSYACSKEVFHSRRITYIFNLRVLRAFIFTWFQQPLVFFTQAGNIISFIGFWIFAVFRLPSSHEFNKSSSCSLYAYYQSWCIWKLFRRADPRVLIRLVASLVFLALSRLKTSLVLRVWILTSLVNLAFYYAWRIGILTLSPLRGCFYLRIHARLPGCNSRWFSLCSTGR